MASVYDTNHVETATITLGVIVANVKQNKSKDKQIVMGIIGGDEQANTGSNAQIVYCIEAGSFYLEYKRLVKTDENIYSLDSKTCTNMLPMSSIMKPNITPPQIANRSDQLPLDKYTYIKCIKATTQSFSDGLTTTDYTIDMDSLKRLIEENSVL